MQDEIKLLIQKEIRTIQSLLIRLEKHVCVDDEKEVVCLQERLADLCSKYAIEEPEETINKITLDSSYITEEDKKRTLQFIEREEAKIKDILAEEDIF
jgi:hypothetical protein